MYKIFTKFKVVCKSLNLVKTMDYFMDIYIQVVYILVYIYIYIIRNLYIYIHKYILGFTTQGKYDEPFS